MIFITLDDQSLVRTIEASRKLAEFLESERFYWIRFIKIYNGHFVGFELSWRQVIKKTSVTIIKELAVAVKHFFASNPFYGLAPLHIASENGNFQVCQYVIMKTNNKNPKGSLKIYNNSNKFQIGSSRIHSKTNNENTPLHVAALRGTPEICRIIMQNLENCNVKNDKGNTPFMIAATNGHFDVCSLIINKIKGV